jgi:ABC-2 type transport system permease protein
MRAIFAVAHNTLRCCWRARSSQAILLGYIVLLLSSIYFSYQLQQQQIETRTGLEAQAQADWASQPDRHPHRVVHFGDFVFKPISSLALLDWGVDGFTGRSVFLEGHRQNTSNFSDVSAQPGMAAFGRLSPAFCVQILLPLLLIFLGATGLSREKENGQLLFFAGNGARLSHVVWGNFAGLLMLAQLALLPLYGALVFAYAQGESGVRVALMAQSYALYGIIVAASITIIATRARGAAQAMAYGVCIWCVASLLLPRAMAQLGAIAVPAPNFAEVEIFAEKELKSLGNFHNPNDPNFKAFRDRVLRQYDKFSVEELPVNFGGLVMQEGERLSSQIVEKHLSLMRAQFHKQNGARRVLDWVNPLMALQTASMAAAGTDYWHFEDFLRQSEQRRFAMVQALNQIHAHQVNYKNDRDQRLSADLWKALKRDDYRTAALFGPSRSHGSLLQAQAALWLWVLVLLWALSAQTKATRLL